MRSQNLPTITALNVKIKIKLTISDVSNNEPMLETCISSEHESLSSSKCWKNNNKNHNIKSQNSHNIISRRFHCWWCLIIFHMGDKIKCQTYRQTVTGVHRDRVITISNQRTVRWVLQMLCEVSNVPISSIWRDRRFDCTRIAFQKDSAVLPWRCIPWIIRWFF